jgi:hypothetical protein
LSAQKQTPPASPGISRRASLGAILLFLWSLFAAQPLSAQESAVSEEQLKAAFVYNFIRFVEWPASALPSESMPLTIGVYGNDTFVNTLAASLREKKAHGHSFVVKKLATASDAAGCHVLFIAKEESRKTAQVIDTVRKQPVLTIGETDDVFENGIIYLLKDDKKQLRFDINVRAAEESKLTVSSHLLRLARNKKTAEESK